MHTVEGSGGHRSAKPREISKRLCHGQGARAWQWSQSMGKQHLIHSLGPSPSTTSSPIATSLAVSWIQTLTLTHRRLHISQIDLTHTTPFIIQLPLHTHKPISPIVVHPHTSRSLSPSDLHRPAGAGPPDLVRHLSLSHTHGEAHGRGGGGGGVAVTRPRPASHGRGPNSGCHPPGVKGTANRPMTAAPPARRGTRLLHRNIPVHKPSASRISISWLPD